MTTTRTTTLDQLSERDDVAQVAVRLFAQGRSASSTDISRRCAKALEVGISLKED